MVGARWALLGPAVLVLAPLQSWFSRDAYAELPVELLALGGLWLLVEAPGETTRARARPRARLAA